MRLYDAFDLYADVIDPMMAFLKRHARAPWGAGGKQPAPEMDLNITNVARRVDEAGAGEAYEYPFAQAIMTVGS